MGWPWKKKAAEPKKKTWKLWIRLLDDKESGSYYYSRGMTWDLQSEDEGKKDLAVLHDMLGKGDKWLLFKNRLFRSEEVAYISIYED